MFAEEMNGWKVEGYAAGRAARCVEGGGLRREGLDVGFFGVGVAGIILNHAAILKFKSMLCDSMTVAVKKTYVSNLLPLAIDCMLQVFLDHSHGRNATRRQCLNDL